MKAFVVIRSDYDYDSPFTDRLISCATFSSHDKAVRHVEKMSGAKVVKDKVVVYDEDDESVDSERIVSAYFMIVETEVDEFE